MWVRSLGQEDPLEEGVATHSSILETEELAGCSPSGHKELDTTRLKRLGTRKMQNRGQWR